MAKTIEPPILMSRILTFVLATAIVVLGVMVFTLVKMAPLERPEVFFVFTPTISNNVVIEPMDPNVGDNKIAMENYIDGFIRQYIIARNTLSPDANIPKNNWNRVVKTWSSNAVFGDFIKTRTYQEYTIGDQIPNVTCSVNFPPTNGAIIKIGPDTYHVNFVWVCENIGGHEAQKNYKILLRIQSDVAGDGGKSLDYLEKLGRNPLGIQVVQYTPMDGNVDPLDSDFVH